MSRIRVGLGTGHSYNVACTVPGPLDKLSQHGAMRKVEVFSHAARTIGQKEEKSGRPPRAPQAGVAVPD
eukprot:5422188-Prymnesium_polylepis.1